MNMTKIKIRTLFGISEFEANGKSLELSGKNGVSLPFLFVRAYLMASKRHKRNIKAADTKEAI